MAFNNYRNRRKDSESQELDIERFAYDVFAYMLTICGFPEEKIPATIRKENTYFKEDVIMNVGLSVLPLAIYIRDDWKTMFELKLEKTGLNNIQQIEDFLKSTLLECPHFLPEDNQFKMQFSLAFFNEMILFLNYKSINISFDSFPKSWSQFFIKLIDQSEDYGELLSSLLIVDPYVSEKWLTNFLRREAIPYGISEGVSYAFSIHSLDTEAANDFAKNVTDEESVGLEDDVPIRIPLPSSPEDSNSGTNYAIGTWDLESERKFQISEERPFVEMTPHIRHTNGITYVLRHCLKGRKRSRNESLKLEFEDAFSEINLEKENASPENRDTKRRR